jgi:hypothetical protein
MTPIHALVYLSDRYITGDRVCYNRAEEWRALIEGTFGKGAIKKEARIRPWSNNIAFFIEV